MPAVNGDRQREEALDEERRFVLALGGFSVDLAGGHLVTHEKIPVGRFNFVDAREVGPGRQSGFVERALDHYFQRALRPTFRLPIPPPAHLSRALEQLGLRPRPTPLCLLLEEGRAPRPEPTSVEVRAASPSETDLVAAFWTHGRERPELRAALDIAIHHPNLHEELQPVLARLDGEPVCAALLFRYRHAAGIHLVATRPWARGRGAASALVARVLRDRPFAERVRFSIVSDSEPGIAHLQRLGFHPVASFVEYALPAHAELALRPAAPTDGPRWRPPRTAAPTSPDAAPRASSAARARRSSGS